MFRQEVRVTTEKTISKQITLNPKLFLLSLYPETHNFNKTCVYENMATFHWLC